MKKIELSGSESTNKIPLSSFSNNDNFLALSSVTLIDYSSIISNTVI
jgi:hypothetical protein